MPLLASWVSKAVAHRALRTRVCTIEWDGPGWSGGGGERRRVREARGRDAPPSFLGLQSGSPPRASDTSLHNRVVWSGLVTGKVEHPTVERGPSPRARGHYNRESPACAPGALYPRE